MVIPLRSFNIHTVRILQKYPEKYITSVLHCYCSPISHLPLGWLLCITLQKLTLPDIRLDRFTL